MTIAQMILALVGIALVMELFIWRKLSKLRDDEIWSSIIFQDDPAFDDPRFRNAVIEEFEQKTVQPLQPRGER